MLERFRVGWARAMTPPARLFIALHLTPDMVTWAGTFFTVVAALVCFPLGWLWQGALIITAFIFSDGIDGQMARMLGRKSTWGAFLDSSLDRIGDGAIFGGIVLFYAGPGHSQFWAGIALGALVMGQVTSYVKARGEALGVTVRGGLAARADRLLLLLVAAFFSGIFDLPWLLPVALSWGFFASTVTVGQRMEQVANASTDRDDVAV